MKSRFLAPFIDVLFSFLLTFICIIMLLNIKNSNDAALQQNAVYQIVITWSGPNDVDLHMTDPLKHHVSFKRREGGEGSLFSLNRDSLGSQTEKNEKGEIVNKVNEEIVSLRGTFEGEYIANGHMYAEKDGNKPCKVTAKLVRVKPYLEMAVKERIFTTSGEEQTFFRFSINSKGEITSANELKAEIVYDNTPEPESQPETPPSLFKDA